MTEKRKSRSLPLSLVHSTVHQGKPCTHCILCAETNLQYTHPVSWKNKDLMRQTEPNKVISPESCICRNCRDSLSKGLKDPDNFHPRWKRKTVTIVCQAKNCKEVATRCTHITSQENIDDILTLSPPDQSRTTTSCTYLCDKHYRTLHKNVHPQCYNYRCATYGTTVQRTSSSGFRHCPNPTVVQEHLEKHTDFEGVLSSTKYVILATEPTLRFLDFTSKICQHTVMTPSSIC